jgi:hypothetical protein
MFHADSIALSPLGTTTNFDKILISVRIKQKAQYMEKWLTRLLHNTAILYSRSCKESNKELYLQKLKTAFIQVVTEKILEQCEHLPGVKEMLTKTIHKGSIGTLLSRVCDELYRSYIETDKGMVEISINRNNFEKLHISPREFMEHVKILGPSLFANEVSIESSLCPNKGLLLKLSLCS